MSLVRPFRALRPTNATADAVIAPPYDVINTQEARQLAAEKSDSFLHVSRPEIDLPIGVDAHGDTAYKQAAKSFATLQTKGVLARDATPSVYIYAMTSGQHVQTGIAATASVRAYDANRVRRHELTRPDKENDRVRHINAVNAQTGPVLSAYRANPELDELIQAASTGVPEISAVGPHDVIHSIWSVSEPATLQPLLEALNALEAIYIADGHHRSAAASRVAAQRRAAASASDSADSDQSTASYEYFLTVVFPHTQMQIFDYNRVVADLNGLSQTDFLSRLDTAFIVSKVDAPLSPSKAGEFGMYLAGHWYQLQTRTAPPPDDPVAVLDVSVLQNSLIQPVLGIADPRTDQRIDFVGGIRGLGELEQRVNSGDAAVAFALYPTSMNQLMAVADAQRMMPPKSTWFEPKLADGLLSHVLD